MSVEVRGGAVKRFVAGAIPIAIVCFLLLVPSLDSPPYARGRFAIFAVSGLVLWFGWKAIQQNVVTKWVGLPLAVVVGVVVGIYAFGAALGVGLLLVAMLMFALPFLVYDLLFRAPKKG